MKESKMTKQQAIKVLTEHNKWRRGGDGPATDPMKLGKAIDTAIRLLSKPAKPKPKPKRFKWIRLKPAKRRAK